MEQKKQQSLWSRLWRAGLLLGGGIGFSLGMVAAVLTLLGGSLLRLWYPYSLSVGELVWLALSLIVGITLLGTLTGWGVASRPRLTPHLPGQRNRGYSEGLVTTNHEGHKEHKALWFFFVGFVSLW